MAPRPNWRATPDYVLNGVTSLLAIVLPLYERTPGQTLDAGLYSDYRRMISAMRRDPRAAARSVTLGEDIAIITAAYRRASSEPRQVFYGLERVVMAARRFVPATGAGQRIRQREIEIALAGLIETLAVTEAVRSVGSMQIDSRDEADLLRGRCGRLLDVAIERAADNGRTYEARTLTTLAGWVSRDLIERGRPLARLVSYETAVPLPAVVLAHKLYQDAGRADEIAAQNPAHDHPSFLPMRGRAMSQ